MVVTNEILSSFIHCQYKAYTKNKQQSGDTSEYQMLYNKLKQIQTNRFKKKLAESGKLFFEHDSFKKSYQNDGTTLNVNFTNSNINLVLDGIESTDKETITPIFISPFEKVKKPEKLYLALQTTFIQDHFNLQIEICKIVFGENLKETKFRLSYSTKKIRKTINELNKVLSSLNPPTFYKNSHCQICEYRNNCLEKLKERDDLSLLAGLKPKEIIQKNSRGVFSVRQLSYLFRPNNLYKKRNYLPELKALAIRENKTFIQAVPKLKESESDVFIDFEGILDRKSNYLLGAIIKTNNSEKEYSFWANNQKEEPKIFIQLLNILQPLKDISIYHYGSYETLALKNIAKSLPTEYQVNLKSIFENSFNLLNVFTHSIYPPTYSNSLKEIASYLKFSWTDKEASGFQSMMWRYQWEIDRDKQLKNKLLRYNIEDCRAMIVIKDWLESIENGDSDKQFTSSFKSEHIFKWGITNYIVKDFEEINSRAYFDYQREHIYLRANKKLYKTTTKRISKNNLYNKVDRKISLLPNRCPFCRSRNLTQIRDSEKLQIDISFMKYGIKKQATLYSGGLSLCNGCLKKITSTNMRTFPMYGYNLMLWSVNQKIQYNQSSENVINFLKDSLKIEVSATQMTTFKSLIAQKYLPAYNEIISQIVKSGLIHIDETVARIKNIDGYVWVFANHDSVYYEFKETRETDFLRKSLEHFKGVLVSDFYSGYDSLDCKQQKCLIHLIRDLNGDFLKHQFDIELKKIVIEFGILLRSIISTIDKYGLKKMHLFKHKKHVHRFYSNVILTTFESEYALAYQKRFIKYRERLFYFLECDNVPWNNNNAEHSIKPFAKWRKKISKSLTKKNIGDHLILLSILQTCKYRGVNFFEFLKSGEISIDKFSVNSKYKKKYQ